MDRATEANDLQQARQKLEAIRSAIAVQNERLTAAHAALDPRVERVLAPAVRLRFEALCTPPERRAAASTGAAHPEAAIRC
jgi:hypothetical protein